MENNSSSPCCEKCDMKSFKFAYGCQDRNCPCHQVAETKVDIPAPTATNAASSLTAPQTEPAGDWEASFKDWWSQYVHDNADSPQEEDVLLFIRELLAKERAALVEAVEGMKESEHVKEWVCKNDGVIAEYFSHNDRQFCSRCGSKLELKEYDREAFSPENEGIDRVLALISK